LAILTLAMGLGLSAQPAPAEDENIPYLVTFGSDADKSWGDDDYCQIFFFKVPPSHKGPVFIRVFDPDTGGEIDEMKGSYNTGVRFSVYGGYGAWSDPDAKKPDPVGNYNSGNVLSSKYFEASPKYDKEWYSFGPFVLQEGEFVEEMGGHVFKVIVQGHKGDDGNLYRFFLSSDSQENRSIEGGNVFTYEYTFRLPNDQNHISQIYPYLDDKVTSVRIMNYDWDNDGYIRVVSVAKRGELCDISKESEWKENTFPVKDRERNTSMEIQFIKNSNSWIKNNNVVVIVHNQYGESLPFYVIPIGGRPVYNPSLRMKAIVRN